MTQQSPDPLRDPARAPTLAGVERAAAKVAALLPPTPLLPLETDGATIWCKAECLQPVGAFKIRGAWHRLTDLTPEQATVGVVGVSSGNHTHGVAWAAKRLGIRATIVMPSNAPEMKLDPTRALGAEAVRSQQHPPELQSLLPSSHAVFFLTQKKPQSSVPHTPHPQ